MVLKPEPADPSAVDPADDSEHSQVDRLGADQISSADKNGVVGATDAAASGLDPTGRNDMPLDPIEVQARQAAEGAPDEEVAELWYQWRKEQLTVSRSVHDKDRKLAEEYRVRVGI